MILLTEITHVRQYSLLRHTGKNNSLKEIGAMHFTDRQEAGCKLAERLLRFRDADSVVLSIPCSGAVVGAAVAKTLNIPFGLIFVSRISHPLNPEWTIGIATEGGEIIYTSTEDIHPELLWYQRMEALAQDAIEEQRNFYYQDQLPLILKGKTVIIVDDCITVDPTIEAAAYCIRNRQPECIIAAAPIASIEGIDALQEITNEVIVLDDPRNFLGATAAHFTNFPVVQADQVRDLLDKIR